MSDQEFDVLDELYFVQSFEEVKESSGLAEEPLKQLLLEMWEKGWIRCMENREEEPGVDKEDFSKNYSRYFYLATKKGLLAHNSR